MQQRETLVIVPSSRTPRKLHSVPRLARNDCGFVNAGSVCFLTLFKIDDIVSSAMAWVGGVIVVLDVAYPLPLPLGTND